MATRLSSIEPLPPEPVSRVADLMATSPGTWALCGGWAVDAWVGRPTREHHDVEVAVVQEDQRALFDHLSGWRVTVAFRGVLVEDHEWTVRIDHSYLRG